jgi:hypothetical protein
VESVDEFGINGSGPVLRAMAAFWKEHGEAFAKALPQLIDIVKERKDRADFFAILGRWIRWRRGTRAILATLFTAAAGAAFYFLVAHLWPVVSK